MRRLLGKGLEGVIEKGPDWYAALGTEKSPGTKIFSVSGHVMKPGNYEVVLGDIVLPASDKRALRRAFKKALSLA